MPRPPLQVDNAGFMRIVWNMGGSPYAVNVFGITGTATTPPDQAAVNTLATAVVGAFTTSALNNSLGTAITLSQVNVRDINVANRLELVGTVAPTAGAATGNLLPLQVSYVVTMRTAFASRRGRGRTYIPGFTVTSNDTSGSAIAQVRTAGVAWVNALQTALRARQWDLAIVSRPVWVETPLGSDTWVLQRPGVVNGVTQILGRDLIWDTQRRRLFPGI